MGDAREMVIVPDGAVTISGVAWQYVVDGDFPRENRERWARLTGRVVRRGRSGWTWTFDMARSDDLVDLYGYVEAAAGAQEAALADEPDPATRRDARGLRRAVQRMEAALRFYDVDAPAIVKQRRADKARAELEARA